MSEEEIDPCSLPELNLSQGTMNRLLGAVGMNYGGGGTANTFTSVFTAEYDEDDGSSIIDDIPEVGSSSLSIRKTVFRCDNNQNGWSDSQFSSHSQAAVSSTCGPTPVLVNSPACLPTSSGLYDTSPLITPNSPMLSPAMGPCTPATPATPRVPLSPSPLSNGGGASMVPPFRPTIPLNTPLEGLYGFKLLDFQAIQRRRYHTSNVIYCEEVQKAFIRNGCAVPFYFTVTTPPPSDSILRAMAIHIAPEKIGDPLICCPKHLDINQKNGLLNPQHFIRPGQSDTYSEFCVEPSSSRLCICTPINHLHKRSDSCYTAVYMFPCCTSDFNRVGQLVQVIFTLEHGSEVVGRCTLDIRVCCSPGRDRDNDLKRKRKESMSRDCVTVDGDELPSQTKTGTKRTSQVEVTKCVVPSKRPCQGLSRQKVSYTIETYPEIIPYINVCVQMMEKVHSVPTTVATGEGPSTATDQSQQPQPQQPTFDSLESWLEHLKLLKYLKPLQKNGITDIAHVLTVTDEELKQFGFKAASHRKKFLEGKSLIHQVEQDQENSPVLFSQSPPPPPLLSHSSSASSAAAMTQLLSQTSTGSVHLPQSQAFEAVEITVKKNISSSSSSSAGSSKSIH